jgi:hypothetical protein
MSGLVIKQVRRADRLGGEYALVVVQVCHITVATALSRPLTPV